MRLLAALLLCVAAPLGAQTDWLPIPEEPPRREDRGPAVREWQYGMDAGFANFIPAQFQERGTRIAVFVERQVHRRFAVQADGNCSRGSRDRVPGEPQRFVSLCTGVLSAVVPIAVHPRVWPYVRAGYGLALWDDNAAEGYYNVDDTSPTMVVGGGLRAYLNRAQTIGVRVDAQRQQTQLYGDPVAHWSFGFGLTVRYLRQ